MVFKGKMKRKRKVRQTERKERVTNKQMRVRKKEAHSERGSVSLLIRCDQISTRTTFTYCCADYCYQNLSIYNLLHKHILPLKRKYSTCVTSRYILLSFELVLMYSRSACVLIILFNSRL